MGLMGCIRTSRTPGMARWALAALCDLLPYATAGLKSAAEGAKREAGDGQTQAHARDEVCVADGRATYQVGEVDTAWVGGVEERDDGVGVERDLRWNSKRT